MNALISSFVMTPAPIRMMNWLRRWLVGSWMTSASTGFCETGSPPKFSSMKTTSYGWVRIFSETSSAKQAGVDLVVHAGELLDDFLLRLRLLDADQRGQIPGFKDVVTGFEFAHGGESAGV